MNLQKVNAVAQCLDCSLLLRLRSKISGSEPHFYILAVPFESSVLSMYNASRMC